MTPKIEHYTVKIVGHGRKGGSKIIKNCRTSFMDVA